MDKLFKNIRKKVEDLDNIPKNFTESMEQLSDEYEKSTICYKEFICTLCISDNKDKPITTNSFTIDRFGDLLIGFYNTSEVPIDIVLIIGNVVSNKITINPKNFVYAWDNNFVIPLISLSLVNVKVNIISNINKLSLSDLKVVYGYLTHSTRVQFALSNIIININYTNDDQYYLLIYKCNIKTVYNINNVLNSNKNFILLCNQNDL